MRKKKNLADGVPNTLLLIRAQRLQEKASCGFGQEKIDDAWKKLHEELNLNQLKIRRH